MNFLELAQRLRVETGTSGSGPETVVGNTGVNLRLCNWIIQAWTDLQHEHENWSFLWKEFSFTTGAVSVRDITPADKGLTDVSAFDLESFIIKENALTDEDERWLEYLTYADWREKYRLGMTARPTDRPLFFTLLPDDTIRLEPMSDGVDYEISGEYRRTYQTLADNADEPDGLAEEFHMIIVYKAMLLYANRESAPEIKVQAEEALDEWMPRLQRRYLPRIRIGAPPIGENKIA